MKWLARMTVLLGTVLSAAALTWNTQVSGSIGILPPSTDVRLLPGETGSYQLKLHNGLGRDTTVQFKANVTRLPEGGSSDHIVLSFPETVFVKRGDTFVQITVTVSRAAIPGLYVLSNWVS